MIQLWSDTGCLCNTDPFKTKTMDELSERLKTFVTFCIFHLLPREQRRRITKMQKICCCITENNNIVLTYTVQVSKITTKPSFQTNFSVHHLNSTVVYIVTHNVTHCRLSSNSLIPLMRTIQYCNEHYYEWLKS